VAQAGQRITVDAHVAPAVAAAPIAPPSGDGRRSAESVAAPASAVPGATASATPTSSPDLPTVSASPSAGPGGGGAHRGRFGLRLRADVDRTLAGAGVAGALDYGIMEQLAVAAGGFRWPVEGQPVYGASAGVTLSFLLGAVRPLLAIEAQVYFQRDVGSDAAASAHLGAHAAVGVQWDIADHVGLYAMAGGQYTSTELGSEDGKLFFVPSLGSITSADAVAKTARAFAGGAGGAGPGGARTTSGPRRRRLASVRRDDVADRNHRGPDRRGISGLGPLGIRHDGGPIRADHDPDHQPQDHDGSGADRRPSGPAAAVG